MALARKLGFLTLYTILPSADIISPFEDDLTPWYGGHDTFTTTHPSMYRGSQTIASRVKHFCVAFDNAQSRTVKLTARAALHISKMQGP